LSPALFLFGKSCGGAASKQKQPGSLHIDDILARANQRA
jgi:hypothetical protein